MSIPGMASAVPRGLEPPHTTRAARWQVFGLVGALLGAYWPSLPKLTLSAS